MKKGIVSLLIAALILTSLSSVVSAEPLTSNNFKLYINVPDNEVFSPFTMRFNLLTEGGTWLANKSIDVSDPGTYIINFPIASYEIGMNFKLVATSGISEYDYYGVKFKMFEPCIIGTYAYRDEDGTLNVCDEGYIVVRPITATYEYKAEKFVDDSNIQSETDYLIWVSKANYKVNVFLKNYNKWEYVKDIPCSIGAKNTPTVTGQFKYHQYQTRWQYDGYYVGPIMRFYRGYAIHSTLVNNNGTDRDARVGKMISHGCVRIRPNDIQWLVEYIPLGTTVYITEE